MFEALALQQLQRFRGSGSATLASLLFALAICGFAARGSAAEPDPQAVAAAEALFAHRVEPLFRAKCLACHGADPQDVRGEFQMLGRDDLLRGGESGEPAIVAGDPAASPLMEAIRWEGLEMPPKENDRLAAAEISLVSQWIAAGAPWPSDARRQELLKNTKDKWAVQDGVTVPTSGGLSADWTNRTYDAANLWPYQPLPRQPAPQDGEQHPVDLHVNRKLATLGLPAAPPAGRRALIRRATFDLLGMPPSPAEVQAFIDDPGSDEAAFAKVVDRLLASPHYGEHWGRHWLDVVRYADSSGYANDYERGGSWRYRDYVIRAFNDDKPYDQFIREQLAGDEMDDTPEQRIAVGFLRMGPWELTGMEVPKVARQRFLDDVTDAVGQVFLGHLLQCARCHDHKFDPLPTRDYYALQAVFATTQFAERPAPFLPEENTAGFEERKYLEQRRQHYQAALQQLDKKRTVAAGRQWLVDNGRDTKPFEATLASLRKKNKAPVTLNSLRKRMQADDIDPALIPPRHAGFEPRDFGVERICRKGLERLRWRLRRYEPVAFSVYSGHTPELKRVQAPLQMPDSRTQGELERTSILVGGDPFAPLQPVEPAALSVVSFPAAPEIPQSVAGRRRALAEWIASPANPLTARVMVNRIWQWHFGKAIAGNPNNFGTTGKKPTHPELLDDLAAGFVAAGWSVKAVHRLIMSSAAYRRSTRHPQPDLLAERDPNQEACAAFLPRRLTAEELRDAMLKVSGEWNPAVGGIPVRPEMNMEAALQPRQVMGTFAEAWQPSPLPQQRHRRSVYALRIRGQRDPFLEVFNSPASDTSCEARDTSTVTPQAFVLFNSEIAYDRALALAQRLLAEAEAAGSQTEGLQAQQDEALDDGVAQRVLQRLFQLAYGRAATDAEVAATRRHWLAMTRRHQSLRFPPPDYPREVTREAVEENTGERFTFVEPLEFFRDFVPDRKPSGASARLRGLAEICLVVLNSNEFVYVY